MKNVLKVVMVILLLLMAGCGSDEKENSSVENGEEQNTSTSSKDNASSFPVTLTDASGSEVVIEERPERIVSVLPSNTEIAFALGLGKEIVGVTDFDDYPKEAAEKTSVGGLEFDIETILSLEPDLVLARESSSPGGSNEAYKQLKDVGIHVLVVNSAESFEETYESIELIADATGKEEQAEAIIHDMRNEVSAIKEKAENIPDDERKKVWVEIQPAPDIYTTGKGTFMHEMLTVINAENAASGEEGWIPYSEEEVVALKPDVIITTYGESVENAANMVKERPGWQNIPAIQNDEVYDVNNDIVSRPGPRLVEGVQRMAELVYPDVFAAK